LFELSLRNRSVANICATNWFRKFILNPLINFYVIPARGTTKRRKSKVAGMERTTRFMGTLND